MLFEPLSIDGALSVRIQPAVDERGFFARTYCRNEFLAHGIQPDIVQASVSYNMRQGTVRGLHFQWPPSTEGKLVRCVRGEIFDVLVDLRPSSATYLKHDAVTLDESNHDAVFIPAGVAHGFQTLVDATEVLYQMTDFYAPDLATGVRWNDSAFGVRWPQPVSVISDRDASYPDFDRRRHEAELARRHAESPRVRDDGK
jgi:dTDP-4-dehydrorhamnose 3,5-epimerase